MRGEGEQPVEMEHIMSSRSAKGIGDGSLNARRAKSFFCSGESIFVSLSGLTVRQHKT